MGGAGTGAGSPLDPVLPPELLDELELEDELLELEGSVGPLLLLEEDELLDNPPVEVQPWLEEP